MAEPDRQIPAATEGPECQLAWLPEPDWEQMHAQEM